MVLENTASTANIMGVSDLIYEANNVLKGEMRFVCPSPEREFFVEDAIEKLNYDLFYIKNMSIFMDFMIVLRTIKVVLFGKGSR